MPVHRPCHLRRRLSITAWTALLVIIAPPVLVAWAADPPPAETGDESDAEKPDLAQRRLQIMSARIEGLAVSSNDPGIPQRLQSTPLFRYDDETRGYVDGTVWRLGETGRPLAIITAELHPNYLNGGPRVVYDFLSLTERPFTARSADVPGWSPGGSAMEMSRLPDAPAPAATAAKRLSQLKHQARRFTGSQNVLEIDPNATVVQLRLLPREIDRYSAGPHERADGALFLLVNGRNPALVLAIETDGTQWRYGVGRLSSPSTLELQLDQVAVWSQPRIPSHGWNQPYTATNAVAEFP